MKVDKERKRDIDILHTLYTLLYVIEVCRGNY